MKALFLSAIIFIKNGNIAILFYYTDYIFGLQHFFKRCIFNFYLTFICSIDRIRIIMIIKFGN